ncbi:MAG: PLP-dependent aminotransferase family protein [Candidatus Nanopelagicales bacterium]
MSESRTNSHHRGGVWALDLLVTVRRDTGVPLHRQIESDLRSAIRSGRLTVGTTLPATRRLAVDLGVSRGVAVEAYEQLVAEGYLTSRSGGYTRVAMGSAPPALDSAPAPPTPVWIDFGYGRADVSHFPRAAWLRSVRRVLTEASNDRFGYLSGRGVPELREALAAYLNRARGTAAAATDIVITTGYAQAVALLLQVLAQRGARTVALEDPSSDDDVRVIAPRLGLHVLGIPVGRDGIDVAALERSGADALILTPSHQWPTGGVLPPQARARVLRWARERGALVIEDDYDAEYRYDRAPIGAMQGLLPDHVAYAGSASKTLAPGLRLGWLLLPAHLVDEVATAKITADRGGGAIDQLAFADFLSRGEFDRHLRRMRPIYRRRRDALLGALRATLPELEPAGVAAGLHLVTWLPPDLDEAALVEAGLRRGVSVHGVTPYRFDHDGPGGLIFGYSALNESAIVEGVDMVAAAVADMAGTKPRNATNRRVEP